MPNDRSGPTELDRRSLLKGACATSTLTLFGTVGVTAQNRRPTDRPFDEDVVNELVVDTDDHPELEHASVTFLRRGRAEVVRGEIRAHYDLDAPDTHGSDEPTTVGHSLSLGPELARRADTGAPGEASVAELEADAVALERSEETGDPNEHFEKTSLERENQLGTHGLDDPDFDRLGDAVTYVQTSSSECGPLCRTALVVDVDRSNSSEYAIEDSVGRFETVDGSTCDGEAFGDRFPCAEIPYVYDCSIPDAFDTTWHVDDSEFDRTSAEADYYNTDFPVIPRTTAEHSQETSVSGTTIEVSGRWEHSGTYGFRTAIGFLLKGAVGAMYY